MQIRSYWHWLIRIKYRLHTVILLGKRGEGRYEPHRHRQLLPNMLLHSSCTQQRAVARASVHLRPAQMKCNRTEFVFKAFRNFKRNFIEFECSAILRPRTRILSCTFHLRRSYLTGACQVSSCAHKRSNIEHHVSNVRRAHHGLSHPSKPINEIGTLCRYGEAAHCSPPRWQRTRSSTTRYLVQWLRLFSYEAWQPKSNSPASCALWPPPPPSVSRWHLQFSTERLPSHSFSHTSVTHSNLFYLPFVFVHRQNRTYSYVYFLLSDSSSNVFSLRMLDTKNVE